jgi:hypothetical protein
VTDGRTKQIASIIPRYLLGLTAGTCKKYPVNGNHPGIPSANILWLSEVQLYPKVATDRAGGRAEDTNIQSALGRMSHSLGEYCVGWLTSVEPNTSVSAVEYLRRRKCEKIVVFLRFHVPYPLNMMRCAGSSLSRQPRRVSSVKCW